MTLLDPRAWLLAVVLAGLSFLAGDWHGSRAAKAETKVTAQAVEIKAQRTEITESKEAAKTADTLSTMNQREASNEKIKTSSGRAALRTGAVRLYCPAASAESAAPTDSRTGSAADPGAILPADSERIYQIGRDADSVVRERNYCISRYNALRDQLNAVSADPSE